MELDEAGHLPTNPLQPTPPARVASRGWQYPKESLDKASVCDRYAENDSGLRHFWAVSTVKAPSVAVLGAENVGSPVNWI